MSNDPETALPGGDGPAGPDGASGASPSSGPDSDSSLLQPEGKRFEEFGLAPDVLQALGRMGIQRATPIQDLVIEPILAGRDVIGKAETGTGKTIGFGAPLAGRIDTQRVSVQALVLTPTRELAQQVAGVIEELGVGRKLGVVLLVGGVHASGQVLKLRSGSQVAVGTPGRVLEFLRDRTLSLVWCETVVLDEADRMLDMGFIDDVSAILDRIPAERQTLLFSATIPPEVKKLSRRYMRDPETHSTTLGLSTVREIRQQYQEVEFRDKFRVLRGILDENPDDTCIIFCNTRRQVIDLDRMLWGHGYVAGGLHGEHEQEVRFRVLEAFRRREIKTLVATDVASRGLDIDNIARIINYEVPDEPEGYVHRIGRTGRALKSGIAITLVARKEMRDWEKITRATGFSMERIGPPARGGPEKKRSRRGSREDRRGRGGRGGTRSTGSRSTGSRSRKGGKRPHRSAVSSSGGTASGRASSGGKERSGARNGGRRRSHGRGGKKKGGGKRT